MGNNVEKSRTNGRAGKARGKNSSTICKTTPMITCRLRACTPHYGEKLGNGEGCEPHRKKSNSIFLGNC